VNIRLVCEDTNEGEEKANLVKSASFYETGIDEFGIMSNYEG
jgi:hypothetical protein